MEIVRTLTKGQKPEVRQLFLPGHEFEVVYNGLQKAVWQSVDSDKRDYLSDGLGAIECTRRFRYGSLVLRGAEYVLNDISLVAEQSIADSVFPYKPKLTTLSLGEYLKYAVGPTEYIEALHINLTPFSRDAPSALMPADGMIFDPNVERPIPRGSEPDASGAMGNHSALYPNVPRDTTVEPRDTIL